MNASTLASVAYGSNVYTKSKASHTKTPNTDTSDIQVVRNRGVQKPQTFKDNLPSLSTQSALQVDAPKRAMQNFQAEVSKLQKAIFSIEDNDTKRDLQSKLGVDNFSQRVKSIVHYKEAFAENMHTLLSRSTQSDSSANAKASTKNLFSNPVYA